MAEKRIHFIDLKAQQGKIRPVLNERIQPVLAHGQYIMGPEVKELEEKLAAYVGVKHAISCSSGTYALLMPLLAYEVAPGDAIFTSPLTFIATAEVIQLLGATRSLWISTQKPSISTPERSRGLVGEKPQDLAIRSYKICARSSEIWRVREEKYWGPSRDGGRWEWGNKMKTSGLPPPPRLPFIGRA